MDYYSLITADQNKVTEPVQVEIIGNPDWTEDEYKQSREEFKNFAPVKIFKRQVNESREPKLKQSIHQQQQKGYQYQNINQSAKNGTRLQNIKISSTRNIMMKKFDTLYKKNEPELKNHFNQNSLTESKPEIDPEEFEDLKRKEKRLLREARERSDLLADLEEDIRDRDKKIEDLEKEQLWEQETNLKQREEIDKLKEEIKERERIIEELENNHLDLKKTLENKPNVIEIEKRVEVIKNPDEIEKLRKDLDKKENEIQKMKEQEEKLKSKAKEDLKKMEKEKDRETERVKKRAQRELEDLEDDKIRLKKEIERLKEEVVKEPKVIEKIVHVPVERESESSLEKKIQSHQIRPESGSLPDAEDKFFMTDQPIRSKLLFCLSNSKYLYYFYIYYSIYLFNLF